MDRETLLWLIGFAASSSYLAIEHPTTFAFDRPVQTAIGALSATAALLLVLGLFRPNIFSTSAPRPSPRDAQLPFARRGASRQEDDEWHYKLHEVRPSSYGVTRTVAQFVLLNIAILLRIEGTRWILGNSGCAQPTWTPWVPLFFALTQSVAFLVQSVRTRSMSMILEYLFAEAKSIWPILFASAGAFGVLRMLPNVDGNYICPLLLSFRIRGAVIAHLLLPIDVLMIYCASALVFRGPERASRPPHAQFPVVLGLSCVTCIICLLIEGFWLYRDTGEYRQWLSMITLGLYTTSPTFTIGSALTALTGLQSISRIGTRSTLMIPLLLIPMIRAVTDALQTVAAYPPVSTTKLQLAMVVFCLGAASHFIGEISPIVNSKDRRMSQTTPLRRALYILLGIFLLQLFLWVPKAGLSVASHPIDLLIAQAEVKHSRWEQQATASMNLAEAADEYRRRYGRNPPPRFDRWYNYTVFQGAQALDDFDNIYNDLLPFWSIPPAELRALTIEAMSNPWNFVGGIILRRGRPEISPYTPNTHRWMVEGVAQMMRPFAKWLPDMVIAFNLNDESRIAVPFDQIAALKEVAQRAWNASPNGVSDFDSSSRRWPAIPSDPSEDSPFGEASFRNSFRSYGIIGCPPGSIVHHQRYWNHKQLCTSCAKPHSLQQFVSDWKLAANPCHQPDLQDLHGFYASPSTFRNSHRLIPIFSQSKAHGYNDILYPSAWNYEEKAVYDPDDDHPDPDWYEKQSTLFWRGGTSEGFSPRNGAWMGLGRQRLAHMFNFSTPEDPSLVLLPTEHDSTSSPSQSYSYRTLTPADLHDHLSADIRIVDRIERCWDPDCATQHAEFEPYRNPPVPFQSHWRYKYLMDLDGAGFSGRFLPFLQSKSLPFKAALMREWWDGRVTAWKHFVPVDLRLTEIWSLLAYFAGWKDDTSGKWLMEPHEEAADKIAREGREWARRILTKEDMEAYFFRLLLEWARLTDDNRDALGYGG